MLEFRQIETSDIFPMIEKIGKTYSSLNDVHYAADNPNHISLYNEIMKFSKEELENAGIKKNSILKKVNLYYCCLKNESPLVFTAFIQKGAFSEQWFPQTQWLIEHCHIKNLDFYSSLFTAEVVKHHNPEQEKCANFSSLLSYMNKYFNDLKEEDLDIIANKLYISFQEKDFEEVNKFVFSNIESKMGKKLLHIFNDNNIDINKNHYLNEHLPHNNFYTKSFFISKPVLDTIIPLLKAGYRFEEVNYKFNEKSLIENLLESQGTNFISIILPYLTRAKPFKISYGEQHALIEKLNKLPNFEQLESHYYQLVENEYNRIMPEKNETKRKKKI